MSKRDIRNIVYAFPAFSFAIPTFPVIIILPILYSEKYGFDVGLIGASIFFAKILDIFSDPLMGWITDRAIVARKVWLILGSLISGLSLINLFTFQEINNSFHLFIWMSSLYLGWTIFQIPYLSIGYELESNYFQRTKLSATREFFLLLGLFFSLCIPMLVPLTDYELGKYLVFTALVSGGSGILLFSLLLPEKKKTKNSKSLFKVFKNIRKILEVRRIMFVWFINSLANVMPMILFAFFVTHVLGGNDYDRQKCLFFYFLFSIIGIPFWTFLSKKIDKLNTWSLSLFCSSLLFVPVLFLTEGNFALFILISCLTGFCLGADLIIPPSIQADLTDLHEKKFGEEISGSLFSLITFINKFSFALGSIFIFGFLDILEFDTDGEVNNNSKIFIILAYALIPIILKLFASSLLFKYKISTK